MTTFVSSPDPALAALFPTVIPDVEAYVLEYVRAAVAYGLDSGVPALSFYGPADGGSARAAAEGLAIDVVAGWPQYPGVVPAIGVAQGPDGEDPEHDLQGAGFAGDVVAYAPATFPSSGGLAFPSASLKAGTAGGIAFDDRSTPIASASYYAEPLSTDVIVELIHEHRGERDRLHNELRRVLFPLRRYLAERDPQIRKVTINGEKTEAEQGTDGSELPLTIYVSLFTVHVAYDMLEAQNVRGADSVLDQLQVAVTPSDSGP